MNLLSQPVTYDAANRWLESRVSVPTQMGSRQLALSKNFPAEVKANSFFSAKVAEAAVLEKVRDISDRYSRRELNLAEARTEAKKFLMGKGYTPNDVSSQKEPPAGISPEKWEEAKQITNLASTARLNLVFKQNAAMADAVGQREVSMDPDILERWPYFRYITGPNPRDEHAALDGLVLPKQDPFWATHTPPWDYNCNCMLEDCDEEEAAKYGGAGKAVQSSVVSRQSEDGSRPALDESGKSSFKVDNNGRFVNVDVPESGFVFDAESAFAAQDMSRIQDVPARRSVLTSIRDYVRSNDNVRFNLIPGAAESAEAAVSGSPDAVAEYVSKQAAKFAEAGEFLPDEMKIGSLSKKILDGLGMTEDVNLIISKGSGSTGLNHVKGKHAAQIKDGTFARALNETVFAKGIRISIEMNGGKEYLNLYNLKTGALSSFRTQAGSNKWNVMSAFYPDEGYAVSRSTVRR